MLVFVLYFCLFYYFLSFFHFYSASSLFMLVLLLFFFLFKQKTAYEMRISDWSSDVCSSDLPLALSDLLRHPAARHRQLRPAVAARPQLLSQQPVVDLDPRHGDGRPGRAFVPVRRDADPSGLHRSVQIVRASCRERVCQSV